MSKCFGRATRAAAIAISVTIALSTTVPPAAIAGASGLGAVPLSGNPGLPAIDTSTDTIYVPIQTGGVEVVNGARCNAQVSDGCSVVATIPTDDSLAATVDVGTDTAYALSGNDIWVIDGARCNGTTTSGCSKQIGRITTGGSVVALALNPLTRTLYMASLNGAIFVANVARCNRLTTSGCSAPVKTIINPGGPAALAVDPSTDTVYAANDGFCAGTTNSTNCESGTGDTVSVINGARCNASASSGCRRRPALIKVGEGADWTEVDQATGTLYITSYLSGTVSVINGTRCKARVTSGCDRPSAVLKTEPGTGYVVLDSPLHTLFTLNTESDTLTETNVVTCNRKVTSGCATKPLSQQAAPTLGAYAEPTPNSGVLDPQTDTLYVVCVGGGLFMNVVDVSRCSSVDTSGCNSSS